MNQRSNGSAGPYSSDAEVRATPRTGSHNGSAGPYCQRHASPRGAEVVIGLTTAALGRTASDSEGEWDESTCTSCGSQRHRWAVPPATGHIYEVKTHSEDAREGHAARDIRGGNDVHATATRGLLLATIEIAHRGCRRCNGNARLYRSRRQRWEHTPKALRRINGNARLYARDIHAEG